MQGYAVGQLPLIKKLKNPEKWKQTWFADDSACAGKLKLLLEWLLLLIKEGPKSGYHLELSKCFLVVAPEFLDVAKEMFSSYDVQVVTGRKFLGGFIGKSEDKELWLEKKVAQWSKSVQHLTHAAKSFPHEAYTALSKSLQNEWRYILRVTQDTESLFSSLAETIKNSFLPAMSSLDLDEIEKSLMCKPARFNGMGIDDLDQTSKLSYQNSKQANSLLAQVIIEGGDIDIHKHEAFYNDNANKFRDEKLTQDKTDVHNLLPLLSIERKFAVERKINHKCSTWLTVAPTYNNGFSMTPDVFRDAVALRYARIPHQMKSLCDGCGEDFTISHALDCKKGGLVAHRHNDFRDLNIDLLTKSGLTQVIEEPVLKESCVNGEDGLRVDWSARSFWEPQREALFDCCILNADAPSHKGTPLNTILSSSRNFKKRKYNTAAESCGSTFTPIIATCEAIFDTEAEVYIKRLASLLATKWKKSYSVVACYIRARMQVAILRSVSLCIRGTRLKWRSAVLDDGAGIPRMHDY